MSQEDEYAVPLQDQRVFGAGIPKRPVTFVPATASSNTDAPASSPSKIKDCYLSIVLQPQSEIDDDRREVSLNSNKISNIASRNDAISDVVCAICNLPIRDVTASPVTRPELHEASIAHQVCLSHSYPPSHLDRTRHGMRYLSSYGWDPDSRLGLGATGDGIRIPLKGKIKNNTLGLGVKSAGNSKKTEKIPAKPLKLNAKQVRKQEQEAKKKREKLQELFYRDVDVERYLGV